MHRVLVYQSLNPFGKHSLHLLHSKQMNLVRSHSVLEQNATTVFRDTNLINHHSISCCAYVCLVENLGAEAMTFISETFPLMSTIDQFATFPASFYKFDTEDYISVSIHFLTAISGSIMVIIVLVAMLRHKASPSMLLLLSLCWADLLFCFNNTVYGFIDLMSGAFSTGPIACLINGLNIHWSCFLSVFSLLAITLERYMTVIYQKPMTMRQAWIAVAVMVFSAFMIPMIPIFGNSWGYVYAMQPAKQICTIAWWVITPFNIFEDVISLGTLMACVNMMAFGYGQIVKIYIESNRRVSSIAKTQNSAHQSVSPTGKTPTANTGEKKMFEFTPNEKKILFKSLAITGLFLTCWTPYLVVVSCMMVDYR
ncbi:hypothetical protein EDD86DRAFT_206382 [Gorgonomyces haynaldii]|nr:hypothetical protein EDD86DRAFT_206382 [Gorgonomyces haynaldii]